jgi:circadian clock protein KaiB
MRREKSTNGKRARKKIEKLNLHPQEAGQGPYLLRLYLTGMTPKSIAALRNIRRICEENLKGEYVLEVVDIYQRPKLASDEQIVAAPTLVKVLPVPIRRLIGDLSDEENVLFGLDLRTRPKRFAKGA